MRVRVRFAKTGKLRFISAIDLGRVWERALRKAGLPVRYSEGFHPHPKVSFGDALPLGLASTAEFAEITFAGPLPLEVMTARLNDAFPDGLRVLDAIESAEGDKRLGKLLQASLWELRYGAPDGLDEAVARLDGDEPLLVDRMRKERPETVDLRPAIAGLAAAGDTVRAVTFHAGFIPAARLPDGSSPVSLRPGDLHTAMGLPAPPLLISRIAQGHAATDPTGIDDALRSTRVLLQPDPVVETAVASSSPPTS